MSSPLSKVLTFIWIKISRNLVDYNESVFYLNEEFEEEESWSEIDAFIDCESLLEGIAHWDREH
jgi:hypothetical protein